MPLHMLEIRQDDFVDHCDRSTAQWSRDQIHFHRHVKMCTETKGFYNFHISLTAKFQMSFHNHIYTHTCSTSQITSIHTWQLCAVLCVGMWKENCMLELALGILLPTSISLRWVPVNNLPQISCTVQFLYFPGKCLQFAPIQYSKLQILWDFLIIIKHSQVLQDTCENNTHYNLLILQNSDDWLPTTTRNTVTAAATRRWWVPDWPSDLQKTLVANQIIKMNFTHRNNLQQTATKIKVFKYLGLPHLQCIGRGDCPPYSQVLASKIKKVHWGDGF